MKLTAVNNNQLRQNNINANNKNVQFKGLTDGLIAAWKIIDGNRGIQFTVEDMLGTNIPRTASGAMSGYEYTKKVNWPYLWQEGIREFLTGPTMTLAPVGILAIITRLSGKTANTHKENIVNLSYLADNMQKQTIDGIEGVSSETFKNDFLTKVISDTIAKTTNTTVNADDSDVESLVKKITDYGKATKKEKKEILASIQKEFIKIVKRRKADYNNTDFSVAKYTINSTEDDATNFGRYVKFMDAYADDYAKANTKNGIVDLANNTVKNFCNNWSIKRVGTIGALIFGTGYIMSFIPKIYTWASGGINPGGKAIYDEAAKREGK